MKIPCPECGQPVIVGAQTISLAQYLFAKCATVGGVWLKFLCDNCGKKVLDGYRDTYGIGV